VSFLVVRAVVGSDSQAETVGVAIAAAASAVLAAAISAAAGQAEAGRRLIIY
jgi:hypothetical protein